jgi:hypothetical protein
MGWSFSALSDEMWRFVVGATKTYSKKLQFIELFDPELINVMEKHHDSLQYSPCQSSNRFPPLVPGAEEKKGRGLKTGSPKTDQKRHLETAKPDDKLKSGAGASKAPPVSKAKPSTTPKLISAEILGTTQQNGMMPLVSPNVQYNHKKSILDRG